VSKKKALIMSIGTGTKVGPEAQQSLAHGLVFSINNHKPDKVFFVVSKESKVLLPLIKPEISAKTEIIRIEDPDDINQIYEQLSTKLKEISTSFDTVTVDFTSGTKAMTGALTILSSLYEVDNLSYVTGKRSGGVVIKGTEKLLCISPYSVILDKKYAEAATLFNKYQFDAVLAIIEQVENIIAELNSSSPILQLKRAALAYSAWDRFDHTQAKEMLSEVKVSQFATNKAFLSKLSASAEKEPFYIADLINNAQRRGEEGKFDDAVARLYRVIELIGQYRLKAHGITSTADVPFAKIPAELRHIFSDRTGKIRIGLEMDYGFLDAFSDELGKKFKNDKALRNALTRRNESIYAHGLEPINKADYQTLVAKAMDFALVAIKNVNALLGEAHFIRWLG